MPQIQPEQLQQMKGQDVADTFRQRWSVIGQNRQPDGSVRIPSQEKEQLDFIVDEMVERVRSGSSS